MFSKKPGFTLLEMMIVIGVIVVLMTITMRFGSSRIQDLDTQTVKEQFANAYQNIHSQSMISNYFAGKKYESLSIVLLSGAHGFDYYFSGGELDNQMFSGFSADVVTLLDLKRGDAEITGVVVQFHPYDLSCILDGDMYTGDRITFTLLIQPKSKKYCFFVQPHLCKLVQFVCE